MRTQVWLCIGVLFLLAAIVVSYPPTITGKVADAPTERVIVILKPELHANSITGASIADEPSIEELQELTAIVQEQVLEDVNSPGVLEEALGNGPTGDVEAEITLETLPAMVVEATPEGIEKLKEHPLVEAVYADIPFELSLADSAPLIKATNVNQISVDGEFLKGNGVAACVLDTGIQADHPAFESRVVNQKCYCYPNCCPNGLSEDSLAVDVNYYSHGTHVSGIIASNGDYKGVAPGANIVAVKVCGSTCQLADIIAAMDYCVTNKDAYNIKVISGSFGDSGNYQTQAACPTYLDSAIDAAYTAGIVNVFASGNNAYPNGVSYPACSPNAIAVGASEKVDAMAPFTNRGPLLEVLAPGVTITSTKTGGTYGYLSGTSQATPHVSGVVALLAQYGELTSQTFSPDEIKQALMSSGISISAGYPRVDAMAALEFLGYDDETVLNVSIISPVANSTVLSNGTELSAVVSGNASEAVVEWSSNNSGVLGTGANITVNLTPGAHLIFANASSGNQSGSSNVSITVLPPALTVSIVSPVANSTLYSNGTSLSASVSGNSSEAIVMWTSNNSGVIASGLYAFVNLSVGLHTITVEANDSNQSANASVDVTVIAPPAVISVSVLSPADNATLLSNGTELSASSSPDSNISWFSNNSGNIANGSIVAINLSAGRHLLTAVGTSGNSSGNASVSVNVLSAECIMDVDLNGNSDADVGDMVLLLTAYTSNSTSCTTPSSGGCVVDLDQNSDSTFDTGDIVVMLTEIILDTLTDIFGAVC